MRELIRNWNGFAIIKNLLKEKLLIIQTEIFLSYNILQILDASNCKKSLNYLIYLKWSFRSHLKIKILETSWVGKGLKKFTMQAYRVEV